MYNNLGIHWASTIPAFLALICVPFPFLFYKFGPRIRKNCKYAAEAEGFLRKMQAQMQQDLDEEEEGMGDEGSSSDAETAIGSRHASQWEEEEKREQRREEVDREEQEAFDYSYEEENQPSGGAFERIKINQSRPGAARRATSYQGNPYDLDRINTRDSFPGERRSGSRRQSRASSRSSRR